MSLGLPPKSRLELLEPRTFGVCLGVLGWLGGLALWQVREGVRWEGVG